MPPKKLHPRPHLPRDRWSDQLVPRSLVFSDAYGYQVREGPFAGCPTILAMTVVGQYGEWSRVRLDTNAGYRELFCRSVRPDRAGGYDGRRSSVGMVPARPVNVSSLSGNMRSARFIAVCLIGCLVTGCALAIGFSAAIGCAVLYKRAFDSPISTALFFVLMSLLALPSMWAGLTAAKFHRLVRWAAGQPANAAGRPRARYDRFASRSCGRPLIGITLVMRQFLWIVAVACALLIVGCNGGDRHMKRKVTASELVGTWKMTGASLQLLTRDGYVASPGETQTITFNADGSLTFASVLDDFQGGTFSICTGTWTLNHDTPVDNQTVRANAIDIELSRKSGTHLRTLSLAEENGKLRIWSYYGDPDSWEFIEYERP